MATTARWPWIAPILIYVVSALEMIIMISPAAAFFYGSFYTPVFSALEASPATAWLPQFFLPHLAHTRWPAFRALSILGALLTLAGLLGFFWCAVQLYYGKFVRKQLVSGGLYGRVRHPQYLCLSVAGAGLLLLWPRFFILATYLLMLGLYYLLARHEEELVRRRYGPPAEGYMASVPMLNPFASRTPGAAWQPPAPGRALTAWLLTVVLGLGVAFGLRAVAIGQLYRVDLEDGSVSALAMRARATEEIGATADEILASDALAGFRADSPGAGLFVQMGSGRGFLKHVLIDLGMLQAAVDRLPLLEEAEFAVVSRVLDRDGRDLPGPAAYRFGTFIEPLYLAQRADGGGLGLVPLPAADFHAEFSRIRF
jgi:protein-S-isoprenylcysteine O-methyltransferase Ste14